AAPTGEALWHSCVCLRFRSLPNRLDAIPTTMPQCVQGGAIRDIGVIEMATHRMTRCRFQHTWWHLHAGPPVIGAARLEAASGGPVRGLRHHAFEGCQVYTTPVTARQTRKQPACVRMARLAKQLVGWRIFDDLPGIPHRDMPRPLGAAAH